MTGMDRHTGQVIAEDVDDIRQSVTDILTTPIGSRVMRRDYGSLLPLIVDQPLVDATLLRAYAATVIALLTWEPRLRVQQITRQVDPLAPGRVVLRLDALTTDTDRPVTIDAPVTAPA